MKVIAFNGSARKDGNTSILINRVFNELQKENIDTDDCVVDHRVIFSWDGVAQGNHFSRCKLWVKS